MKKFRIHLVSDATGETVSAVARACLAQFDKVQPLLRNWTMVREATQIEEVLAGIKESRGIVLYTLVDRALQEALEEGCRLLQVPCVSILDPTLEALRIYLGAPMQSRPGRQHELDSEYFSRIDAIQFVLDHDDGQLASGLRHADVVVAGVSRTLKTPTCIYLANRGVRAANLPIMRGIAIPEALTGSDAPLVVGVTKDPKRLVEIRRNRLRLLERDADADYTDIEAVSDELRYAASIFEEHGWPVIDVSERSVEEVAAMILKMYRERVEEEL
jgi:[pyruvate, water dikinase]-phosphate phosphotransferase / [pyruvate, water dikinase] kinase